MYNSFDSESSDNDNDDLNNYIDEFDSEYRDDLKTLNVENLNNKSLFNRDYLKFRILVDTHNVKHNIINNDFDYSNYEYYLSNNSNNINDTGGFGRFKNVIGFKFIKCIIPNKSYIIDDSNNILAYSASNSSGTTNVFIELTKGVYTIEDIINSFPSSHSSSNIHVSGSSNKSEVSIISSNITFNNINNRYTFKPIDPNTTIKFLWSSGLTDTDLSDKTNNKLNILKKTAKSFGFYPEDLLVYNSSITSQMPPDLSTHYVDLIVKEIPYISCKHNPTGYHIIERIPLSSDYGTNVVYEPGINEEENYFLPISLDKLSIELRDPINGTYYKTKADHSFEFEITIMRNNKNLGLIG
tara:strand:- start:103 stop:1164 length:1062 start_codon:yes stop_codon:yes gene_type:complete